MLKWKVTSSSVNKFNFYKIMYILKKKTVIKKTVIIKRTVELIIARSKINESTITLPRKTHRCVKKSI